MVEDIKGFQHALDRLRLSTIDSAKYSRPMPSPTAPAATLESTHEVTSRLFRVVDRARHGFAEIAVDHDLTAQQARCLLFLIEPRPMSELAAHLHCDASNVTGIADRLAERDLVERVPGRDRRVRLLSLTDAGRGLRERLATDLAHRSLVSTRLDEADRAQLVRLLDKVLDAD